MTINHLESHPKARITILSLLFPLFLPLLTASYALAQQPMKSFTISAPSPEETVIISADTVTWLRGQGVLEFHGNVRARSGSYKVEADRIRADLAKNTIEARGRVTVKIMEGDTASEVLSAEKVLINTRQGAGWMESARMRVPLGEHLFTFQGKRVTKKDDHIYVIEGAYFTWCQCAPDEKPDWAVAAKSMEADTEGDAEARGARIYIRGREVMKVPFFRYPLVRERRSGLLFPVIETSSSDGAHVEQPFYLVLGRSADFTFYPRYILLRGMDLGGEFRYNLGSPARGEVRAFGIDDYDEQSFRGGVRIKHRTETGDVFTAASDVAIITDNEALFDFDHRHMGDENQRALESRMMMSYHPPYMSLTAELSVFDDLMGGDLRDSPFGDDRDEIMVQRLPALSYTLLTRPLIGPAVFDVSAYAANYYRQDPGAGRGQVLWVMPRAALPWRFFDAVDFWAAAGYKEWLLAPEVEDGYASRAVGRPEAELLSGFQVERIFNTDEHVLRHSVRPSVVAFYGGEPGKVDDDVFRTVVPGEATGLSGLHLDTRLWSRPAQGGAIQEAARLELIQLYDFQNGVFRDLRAEAGIGRPSPWRVDLDAYYGWENSELSRINLGLGYRFKEQGMVRAGYRYDTGEVLSPYFDFEAREDEAVTGEFDLRIFPRHRLGYHAHYSIVHNTVIRQGASYSYLARQKCWAMDLTVTHRIRPSEPEAEHEISGSVNIRLTDPAGS